MLGNDIVAPAPGSTHEASDSRFYTRISSRTEQAYYYTISPDLSFSRFIWLLWSVKESAYKCLQREDPDLLFSPVDIQVRDMIFPRQYFCPEFSGSEWIGTGSPGQGIVESQICFNSTLLYARSIIHPSFIASIASSDSHFKDILQGIKMISSTDHEAQSMEVRTFALERLPSDGLFNIRKSPEGCPLIYQGDKKTNILLSLSHHDRFVFYSISHPH